MEQLQVEDIRVPEDVLALELHNDIHTRLVEENAAGAPRLLQSLEIAQGLAEEIESARTSDSEVITLAVSEEQQKVLRASRRLGPLALST